MLFSYILQSHQQEKGILESNLFMLLYVCFVIVIVKSTTIIIQHRMIIFTHTYHKKLDKAVISEQKNLQLL